MARLQDFATVTPSGSDKLLIVQSQGQGLASLDSVAKNSCSGVTITPNSSNITFSNVGGSKIGNQVVLSATVNFTGSQNQWTTLGTVNIKPSQDPRTTLTRNAYGDVCGIIRIQSNGTVSAFTTMAVTGNMSFSICYITNS